MWFLPKDYVWVDTRIDKAHEKHWKDLSIETEFDIKDKTVIFTARVNIKSTEQVFTWHSFWEVGKEKAFEKLETVAVGRALAFAWFETRDGIASREEMEVWETKKEKPNGEIIPSDDEKEWFWLENWEKFKVVDHKFTDPTEAVKKARKFYKVSIQWWYKMEDYFRTGEDKPLDSYPKK